MQKNTNSNIKKSDGFINLSVVFTDAGGVEHTIKAPTFGLDADIPVQAALLQNPDLAEHLTFTVTSIRKVAVPAKAEDLNLQFDAASGE